jgi:chromate transporter
MVTFGEAYALLPYVAQQAVQTHHWLSACQMLNGLGLAETTPGPLIMVTQFVVFLGGWNHPGQLPPLLAATLGVTTWTTFTPCLKPSCYDRKATPRFIRRGIPVSSGGIDPR